MGKKKHRQRHLVAPSSAEPSILSLLEPYRDWIIFALILLFSSVVWWPTRNLPYHWDSAGFVINAARRLLETHFSPFVAEFSDFAHPPLLVGLLALTWQLFGQTHLVSHVLMFPFLPTLLISTYGLGKRLANWRVGLGAAVLVGWTPFILGEYGLIYVDLPTGALTTLALWLWFEHRTWWSMLVFSLAVGIKLPVLVLLAPLTASVALNPDRRRDWRSYLPLLMPPLFAAIWLGYHYQVTGWLLTRPERPSAVTKSLTEFWNSSLFVLDRFFFSQYRWAMALVGLGSVLYVRATKKGQWQLEWKVLAGILGVGLLFFIVMGEFGLRYAIFLMPLYALLVCYWLDLAIKPLWGKTVTIATVAGLLMLAWHPTLPRTTQYEFRFSEDLSYRDFITIGQAAAHYVEINFPQALVYGSFPENYQLTKPYQGYVKQPIELEDCQKFKPLTNRTQLIYVHPYSPFQQYCRQLIDLVPNQQLKLFESNGKWIELYQVVATSSGQAPVTNGSSK